MSHTLRQYVLDVNAKLDKIVHPWTELEALKEKVSSLEKESKDLKDSIGFAQNEITDLKSSLRLLQRGTPRERAYSAYRRARLLEAAVNQVRILL